MSLSLRVEKLLVTQLFYDLLKSSDDVLIEINGDSLTYKGYPVEVDNTVRDMKFIFDVSVETEGATLEPK